MRGAFVTFEGPEGSGKSTQAARLRTRLEGLGLKVLAAREPGGTPTGEFIREILQHDRAGEPIAPETELLLFAASRAQLVRRRLEPALAEGAWVVCDRFMDSTTAYQGYGRGFDVATVLTVNAFAVGATQPDVTVLLDLDVATSLERMRARNAQRQQDQDRFEREHAEFHARVRDGYLALAARWPARFRVIDSDRPVDAVAEDVWGAVAPLLALRLGEGG